MVSTILLSALIISLNGRRLKRNNTALTVATFLSELMCRHGSNKWSKERMYLLAQPYCCRATYNLSISSAVKWLCERQNNDKECLGKKVILYWYKLEYYFVFRHCKNDFVILFSIPCKKKKHLSFLLHFGKRIEDKCFIGGGLDRCDR